MRFLSFVASATFALLFVLSIPGAAHAAGTTQTPITLSIVRAVRISTTTLTLSFKTSTSAVGILRYTTADGGDLTLTDSVPEVDHLFTIQSLDPAHGYTFILRAENTSNSSNTYNVLLSLETLGPVGASELPGVQEIDAQGTVIANTITSSSTQTNGGGVPLWAYLLLIFVAAAGYGIYIYMQRMQPKTDER
jgi:hypothetical protein